MITLCVRQSKKGGESYFASGYTIYNRLLDLYPDCIEELCQGFRYYMIGTTFSGPQAVTSYHLPTFSWKDGVMSVSHIRTFIEKGAEHLGVPLTESQIMALDYFDAVANSSDVCLEVKLEPGDLVICNNNMLMHGRNEFLNEQLVDQRLLLRLWVMANEKWPLVSSLERRNHSFVFKY